MPVFQGEPTGNSFYPVKTPSAVCEKPSELESFNFIGIAGSRFHGLAGRGMADCSGAREQRMSGGLTTATRRQKKSSYLTASPSNSGKDEIRICCPTLMTIYLSGITEAGKSIAEHRERTQAASAAKSTALSSGISEIRRALPLRALR